MQKVAVWKWWLESGMSGILLAGVAQAAAPPDVIIRTPDEALAFSDAAPFVFEGQRLEVHHDFIADRAIALQQLAPIMVAPGVRFELNGVIASLAAATEAPLEKLGEGTLVLGGENQHTSNTVLSEGTLALRGDSALGHTLYNLEQQAGTVLELAPDASVTNLVRVVDTQPGRTPLPGHEAIAEWRVEAGQADLLGNVNALVPVHKTGEGSLRVGGGFLGEAPLVVKEGALVLDGAAGHIDVAQGARLEGSGAFGSLRVRAGGWLAPGGREDIASLSSWGEIVFEPGSTYHVNVSADGHADSIFSLGSASLAGAVRAEAGEGHWVDEHHYRILTAQGGLGGTRFDAVQTNLAFLTPQLQYDDQNAYLLLSRNDLGVGEVGETPDDQDVGDVIDPSENTPAPEPPETPIPEPPGTRLPEPPPAPALLPARSR